MEVDEIQRQVCKFQRIGNGRSSSGNGTNHDGSKVVQKGEVDHHHGRYHPDDEEDGVLVKRSSCTGGLAGGIDILSGGGGRLCGWPSSRIVRVSRASGGKDRHSKVLTSKGLRDRRVRLSVTTAIQFYDLQDRLGYDQPSKAVEWLLKAASSSIAELPSLNPAFPDTPKQLSDEKRSSENTEPGFESAEVELDGDPNFQQHHQQGQNASLSKSACSSTSETSKGSGLSLSRSESRIKARERARERAAEKEKEKENDSQQGVVNHRNVSPISQNSSFTELLTAGISSVGGSNSSPNGSAHQNSGGGGGTGGESSLVNRSRGQWTTPMDYRSTGIFAPLSSRGQTSSGFPGHIQLGNSLPQFNITTTTGDHHHHHHHPELQHFSFVPENFVPVATTASGNSESYNLNFSISSSALAGFNRGTLQSNSPSLLPPHLQRFPSIDGSNLPFFIGSSTTAASNATAPVENHHHNQHHHFLAGFDASLQRRYGDIPAGSHSDHKGKGKN